MDQIAKNLHNQAESFYYSINEGYFDNDKFKKLTNSIYSLNSRSINRLARLEKSIELWELGFSIQRLLTNHFDKKDAFKISNLNDKQICQLSQVIYYLCNWFSYNKKMEKKYLDLDSWL